MPSTLNWVLPDCQLEVGGGGLPAYAYVHVVQLAMMMGAPWTPRPPPPPVGCTGGHVVCTLVRQGAEARQVQDGAGSGRHAPVPWAQVCVWEGGGNSMCDVAAWPGVTTCVMWLRGQV